jgi:MFS family permease
MASVQAVSDPQVGEGQTFSRQEKITVALSSFGGALEFFDFTIFIFLTPVITAVFFPADLPEWVKQISAFSIFALGWFVRPVGGTVIAYYGDRYGRKKLFMLTILCMAVATMLTGLLPSYAAIGVFSPLLLIVLRLVQGIAIGGEVPGALTFVAEHVSKGRLGFACSIFGATLYTGLLFGSGLVALITSFLPADEVISWGWRIPFIVGGFFALFVVYLRRNLTETPMFEKLQKAGAVTKTFPLAALLKTYWPAMCFAVLYAAILSIIITGLFTFLPTPLITIYKFPREAVLQSNAAAIATLVVFGPIWGLIADRFGFTRTFILGNLVTMCASAWFYFYLQAVPPSGEGLTLAWMVVGAAAGSVCWLPAIVTQSFSTQVRYTGFALPYNVGLAAFTGLLPIVITLLNQFAGRGSLFILAIAVSVLGVIVAAGIGRLIARGRAEEILTH